MTTMPERDLFLASLSSGVGSRAAPWSRGRVSRRWPAAHPDGAVGDPQIDPCTSVSGGASPRPIRAQEAGPDVPVSDPTDLSEASRAFFDQYRHELTGLSKRR